MATVKETKSEAGGNLYKEETYKITLPISDKKQDDVIVIINGETTQIQRGVEVEVSAGVYEVLKNSEKMDTLALRRRKALNDKNK